MNRRLLLLAVVVLFSAGLVSFAKDEPQADPQKTVKELQDENARLRAQLRDVRDKLDQFLAGLKDLQARLSGPADQPAQVADDKKTDDKGKTEIKGDTKTDTKVDTKVSLLDLSLLSPRVNSTKNSEEQNKLLRDMVEARDREIKRLRKLLTKNAIDPD